MVSQTDFALGIIGGSGQLGRAILHGLLSRGGVPAEFAWVSNRSGKIGGFDDYPDLHVTTDNWELAADCDIVFLCVPPATLPDIKISAPHALVVSFVAGATLDQIQTISDSPRVIRAMTSPAADVGLAYTPWVASEAVTTQDKARLTSLLTALGATDELPAETQIDLFTAMTGPVPGFVAFFADCMAAYGASRGLSDDIAQRATRQLFLAAGHVMASGAQSPAEHVQSMIDYNGTTAAGLEVLRRSAIASDLADGLDAAVAKTRSITPKFS